MLEWKIVNDDYLDYLRNNYDNRIPFSDYGDKSFKPFFGELFEIDGLVYVTQISSAKLRHRKMKNAIDFYKIYYQNRFISVVNLNYMFPVPKSELSTVLYKNIGKYRKFDNNIDKSKYIQLLKIELQILSEMPLEENALNIYKLKQNAPKNSVSMRCLDFKKLEKAAVLWEDNKVKTYEFVGTK